MRSGGIVRLSWCLKQKNGIELVEPNDNLCDAYIEEAQRTLNNMLVADGTWKVVMAYYACYHSLYAILMESGVKSEIHECTIELMSLLGFSSKDISYMRKLKDDRIQAQYYLKKRDVDEEKVKSFVLLCFSLLKNINVNAIRTTIEVHNEK